MKNDFISSHIGTLLRREASLAPTHVASTIDRSLPEILFITSYPPRECGIATYSQDLIRALNNKFTNSFSLKVCALESEYEKHQYPEEVKYILDTSCASAYRTITNAINNNDRIKIVLIQHEFGFFRAEEEAFLKFLDKLSKPIITAFHTVLPHPDSSVKEQVQRIALASASLVVMTHNAAEILMNDYGIAEEKITVIAHGTHLVPHVSKKFLKVKYELQGKKVLSTFGLLSSGKSIETTLEALPAIITTHPEVVFLVLGKTHPGVVKSEGEKYRSMLERKVEELHLGAHVKFVNSYLPLPRLLEYLQLTDIYLFTSKDPHQAVSGTFSYAMSCACPIISTPIPHAREVLNEHTGIIIDFQNSAQLAAGVISLLENEPLRKAMSLNTLQKIISSAWENSAVAHAMLFTRIADTEIPLEYKLPPVNMNHVKQLTTSFGMIQFSKVNQPDSSSGYTLDDNSRALVALCMHYELTGDENDLTLLGTYLNFIKHCLGGEPGFLNYVDKERSFTSQNTETNLEDANGRAMWALGYLISKADLVPEELLLDAEELFIRALPVVETMHSTRAMAFAIKGLYYYHNTNPTEEIFSLTQTLALRLSNMYKHESEDSWKWFESYLTYGNSILPEAMLCAWLLTGDALSKDIAKESFDFLLSQTFTAHGIKVISNKTWLHKGEKQDQYGEQPIDVTYTILALSKFYEVFADEGYLHKMEIAFNWFLGRNHLHQIIYNPCTGGCYDGLEETQVNLNQGAESTVSYLMARLTIEKYSAARHMPEVLNHNGKHAIAA